MSARGDLVAMASGAWISDYATSREDVDAFLREAEVAVDAYAHELAERIRNENPDRSSDWSDGVDWSADLIDPEVE